MTGSGHSAPETYREPGGETEERGSRSGRRPRLAVLVGARGGVGTTLIAANIGVYLATLGRRVVVVDAAPNGPQLHTLLGAPSPCPLRAWSTTVGSGSVDARDRLQVSETSVTGLRLAYAGLGEQAPQLVRRRTLRGAFEAARELDADVVVLDVGVDGSGPVLDVVRAADVALHLTAPEPPSVEATYRTMRRAFARHLLATIPERAARVRMAERLRSAGHVPPPLDLARRLEAAGDPLADVVREAMQTFRFRFAVNHVRTRTDLELGDAMRRAARRRLGLESSYLGYVEHDDVAWTSVRLRRPLLVESPGTKSSKSIEKLARRLLASDLGLPRRPQVPPESHHDLLEVDRGASDEEIRRAYKRAREMFSSDALACHGLFDGPALEVLRARLEEAHDVLLDPARREVYERSVFPEATPARGPSTSSFDETPRPPPPVLTPDTEITGALLRALRESQGVELSEVARRTKIGIAHLESIEREDFAALPAPVYVRGFVTEIAKVLRIDPVQAARTYMRRFRRMVEAGTREQRR
ncbi:MAG: helix-turn-helix domain-containing protein [Myxococcota bacterium]|nr:helix-turn-helix domain-containing protein [Myxococcota bacterium]MDW8361537.1 helix-turn-helix domain-containing protein [Myxococcales bacterium]